MNEPHGQSTRSGRLLHYIGTNIRGTTVSGSTVQRAAAFVEQKFRRGWCRLEVTEATTGRKVGWIKPADGARSFWAEGEPS